MLVSQSCLTLCDPMNCGSPGSSVHGILQARILEWAAHSLPPGDLPIPGIEPRSPALQADPLPSEPQGFEIYLKYSPAERNIKALFSTNLWRRRRSSGHLNKVYTDSIK